MPLYSYECSEHGLFDEIRSIHDETPMLCPECQKVARKIMCPVRTISKQTKMGKTREELFQNLGKEGCGERDMWKGDKDYREESYHSWGE